MQLNGKEYQQKKDWREKLYQYNYDSSWDYISDWLIRNLEVSFTKEFLYPIYGYENKVPSAYNSSSTTYTYDFPVEKVSENNPMEIERVVFNPPFTVVFFEDGSKSISRCHENDTFDPEVGVMVAVAKKIYPNRKEILDLVDNAFWQKGRKQKKQEKAKRVEKAKQKFAKIEIPDLHQDWGEWFANFVESKMAEYEPKQKGMEDKDVKIGMKVVPFRKSVYSSLEDSLMWNLAKDSAQPFLFVKDFDEDLSGWLLVDKLSHGGDYFLSSDFYPYVEK